MPEDHPRREQTPGHHDTERHSRKPSGVRAVPRDVRERVGEPDRLLGLVAILPADQKAIVRRRQAIDQVHAHRAHVPIFKPQLTPGTISM